MVVQWRLIRKKLSSTLTNIERVYGSDSSIASRNSEPVIAVERSSEQRKVITHEKVWSEKTETDIQVPYVLLNGRVRHAPVVGSLAGIAR